MGSELLHLLDDEFDRGGLLVGRVAVADQQPLDRRTELGADVVADGPVRADVATHDGDEVAGDLSEHVLALEEHGGVVLRDGVVEGELVVVERGVKRAPRAASARMSLAISMSSAITWAAVSCSFA
jgi:hypothetical protein